jgi:hypothetical protein
MSQASEGRNGPGQPLWLSPGLPEVTAVEGEQVGGNLTGHQLHSSPSQGQAGQAFQAHVLEKKKIKHFTVISIKKTQICTL